MTAQPKPTSEMITFYERRTREHIARVAANLQLLADGRDCGDALVERAGIHDASKFEPAEYLPYVWLTEFHRCRRCGEPFSYPDGMEEQVKQAVRHHVTSNRHHPEFHDDPDQMTDVDLIEMVCDWTAMSEEFGQDGGSARGWANKTLGSRVKLNAEKTAFVYQIITELDQLRGIGG